MNIFLRHGEVKNPKDILYYNIPGYELSKLGKSQAEYSAEVLSKDFKIEQIISSPLLRARQTSEIVSNKLKMEFSISEKITEWDGLLNWKGYTFDEITKTKKPPIKVIIFIRDDMWSITTLSLNKVSLLTEKVSLIVIIAVIKIAKRDKLKVILELSFLNTPKISRNIIDREIKISGNIKFKFSILFTSYICVMHIN